ncbi:hypothetical protein [Mesorhizobium sp. M1E.F.Ca.ET.063.01.1.1]|uniref:hypothetical protein n=1 Tax=Mesorhizobium sp. M1E.F.Ca.ET.063.01.1.1 TaxID=2496750 RepID=UPI000FCA133A|nr:hypothetical protein [Mesorhizobium sp. M1E.F.Ca.ET.063.01.1.1]RUW85197.1 hypothetical protein EOA29_05950 [Mesorhizobium sp. M1E.F.Ca.ET.063.01.1.1]
MEKKRARRRRDLLRMKQRALRIYPHDKNATQAEYLAVCSCWMCGNQRRNDWQPKIERLTMQERRFFGRV